MNKENLINAAKEFARKVIFGEEPDHTDDGLAEEYYMFLISRFLLLKETIIKKDSIQDCLYFNYTNHSKYLPAIKYVVDYIISNGGEISRNGTQVIIEPTSYNTPELQNYIWIFNKIRDSFAHGAYEFDIVNQRIIIDNDNLTDPRSPYKLKCSIPIEVLEKFDFTSKFFNCLETRSFEENSYNLMNFERDYHPNLKNEYIKLRFNELKNKKINTTAYSDNYNLKKQTIENKLFCLIKTIEHNKENSKQQRNQIVRYLQQKGLINTTYDTDSLKNILVKTIKQLEFNSEEPTKYLKKIEDLIDDIINIIGASDQENNLAVTAIYNYMQLTFSIRDYDFLKQKMSLGLGFFKASKFTPKYLDITTGVGKNYIAQVHNINIRTDKFLSDLSSFIQSNKNILINGPESARIGILKALQNNFKGFYQNQIGNFADKNSYILTSIRNATEHANISVLGDKIFLTDQNNQNDSQTKNFTCSGTPQDFFEVINNLSSGNFASKDSFQYIDFIQELNSVLTEEIAQKYLNIISDLQNILGEEMTAYVIKESFIEAINNPGQRGRRGRK